MALEKHEIRPHWTEEARKRFVGRKIVEVRYMTDEERRGMYWSSCPIVIKLDDGTLIYPTSDDEGNDGGALHGISKNGMDILIPVIRDY